MTPEDWRRVRPILAEALELPSDRRTAFLDSACGGDPHLRSSVESMIRAGEMDGGLQGATAAEPALAAVASEGGPGPRVGRYQIKRLIGSGGMGVVYEALQEHPRRTVALKVMRKGISSRSAMRRFEYEAQLLGRLRHPGIAQVFEAGTHRDGAEEVPYFAMEYIPAAKSLTEYAVARSLGTRDRLGLFIKVCDAVHHGHTKGIIHRDLKPANILVDSSGQPKIIDFGVARTTDSDMAAVTLQTDVGQLVGTLQYMSPEQCAADPHDIDTRADVYSLGVILYELLCGRPPHDLSGASVIDAARIVRESAAPRPSTINATLRGDLETVTLKAMDKDRDRRYRSASELADDLKRYLNSEPISARPASLVYQLRMFARRNRGLVTLVGSAVTLLCLAAVGATWAAVQIDNARSRAQTQAENAEALNTFLRDMLTLAAPARAQGNTVTVRDAVDLAASKLTSFSPAQAEVEAAVRAVIGTTYRALGAYDAAEPQLRRALEIRRDKLGDENPLTLVSITDLALLMHDRGESRPAAELLRSALTTQSALKGARQVDTGRMQAALAWVYRDLGRSKDAEALFREALDGNRRAFGSDSAQAVKSMTELAMVLIDQQKLSEADALLARAVESGRVSLGEKHPDFLYTNNTRGWLQFNQGKYEDAAKTYASVVAAAKEIMPPNHAWTLLWKNNLGWALVRCGRFTDADPLLREVMDRDRQLLGDAHRETLRAELGLAQSLTGQHRLDEAETHALHVHTETSAKGPAWLADQAAAALVDLYDVKRAPEQAAKYRAMLPPPKDQGDR